MTPADQIYSLPTNVGTAKMTYGAANNLPVQISHMAIGDGNGALVSPGAGASALVHEVYRAQLNQLYQHDTNPNWLVAELVLPAEVGGWTIREIGLYDTAGDLIYVGNHAEQYKPVQSQGSDETKTIRMVILTSSTSAVTLKTDPTTVMASIDYVQRELAKLDHKQSVRYTTTGAIALAGLAVQAGGDWAAPLTAGDRVLVKNQAAGQANCFYSAAAGAWVRATDADISAEVTSGLIVAVESGTTLADTRWQLVTDGAIVLGTTALVFQNVTQGFASLVSPEFTGNPKTPLAPKFDNDSSLVSSAWVLEEGDRLSAKTGMAITADTTLAVEQLGGAVFVLNPAVVTLPPVGVGPRVGALMNFVAKADFTLRTGSAIKIVRVSELDAVAATSITVKKGETITVMDNSLAWVVVRTGFELASPNFSGNPTTPTPPQFDNDFSLINSEFLQRALGNMRGNTSASILANIALDAADAGRWWVVQVVGVTVTLPAFSGITGKVFYFKAGKDFTLAAAAGEIIYGATTAGATRVVKENEYIALLHHNAGGWHVVVNGFGAEAFSSLLAPNGYEKKPGGAIEQWGSFPVPASASGAVSAGAAWEFTLPTTFPGGAFQVVASFANPSAGTTGAEISGNKIYLKNSHTAPQTVRWIAKGN
jgi:hypothetical protein